MNTFELYLSGLNYGTVFFGEDQVFLQKLDVKTGELEARCPITEADSMFYRTIFNVDIKKLYCLFKELENMVSSDSDCGQLKTGEVFQRWTEDNPWKQEIWVQRQVKYPWDLTVYQGEIVAVTIPSRERIAVLVKKGFEQRTVLKQWQSYLTEREHYLVSESRTETVVMRDGVQLAASVILPGKTGGRVPSILIRTPYGKEDLETSYYSFVRRGYAVVIQDVRGRNESEGDWKPMVYEREDGDDTINWIAAQSWSDGSVGMLGGSYLGYVQWAAAGTGNPHLKALISFVTAGPAFMDLPRKGGTMSSGTLAWAFALSQKTFKPELMMRQDWAQVMKMRPMETICEKALGYSVPFLEEWFRNSDDCALWKSMDWAAHKQKIQAPALIISGWYDDNEMGTTQALDVTADYPKGKRKVILGPWVHSGNASRDIHGVPLGNNSLRYDIDLIVQKWLDHQLLGISNGIDETAAVEYYTVGSNRWKTAETWPVSQTREQSFYLVSKGMLSETWEQQEGCDTYSYDPSDETPYLVDVSENEFGVPGNYRDVDERADVLVYETPTLEVPMTITGDMTVTFYGGSDAPDTDWIVKVEHVDEDGNAIKMTDGLLCAKYRNGYERAEYMENGEVYCFTIRTGKISDTLYTGHRLRLTITSSASGLCFPNSNTRDGYNSMETQVATNSIYFGERYPSRMTVRAEQ